MTDKREAPLTDATPSAKQAAPSAKPQAPPLTWTGDLPPLTTPHAGSKAAKSGVPDVIQPARGRVFWYDARHTTSSDPMLDAALQNGFDRWLLKPSQVESFRQRSVGMGLVIEIHEAADLTSITSQDVAMSRDTRLLQQAKQQGFAVALWVCIDDAASLEYAYKNGAAHDYLIAELVDETNIPLELVVAELQADKTIVLKAVPTAEAAEVSFGVVEYGADGALLQSNDAAEIIAVGKLKRRQQRTQMQLCEGRITRVEHLGMGHRACVDVVSLMTPREGMLIGSTSTGGVLACSETHPLPYMDLRPFRVNAGAIHSYIWCPDNRTHYLSELKAGSRLLCVDIDGNAREVIVGRIKTEIRPLLLLEADCDGITVNAILQDDWHVRVYHPDGHPISVTTFKPGDPILCYTTNPGRHVGISVKEQIIER